VQYTGRLLRPFEGKQVVRIHDYLDPGVAMLQSMHAKRLAAYRKLGYLKEPRRGRRVEGPSSR
jgi:superfamily II DNA or RNA helicase